MKKTNKIKYTPVEYEMQMFNEMRGHYVSKNEEVFFETMLRKIQTEFSETGDIILHEDDNDYGIYLIREMFDDFEVGRAQVGAKDHPVFTNGLFGILSIDLGEFVLDEHITLLDWLRSNDYKGVKYDYLEGKPWGI